MVSEPGSSEQIVMEINFDDKTVTIIPQTGGVKTYDLEKEGITDMIDRLAAAGADYTVYAQGETLSKEEFEALSESYRDEKEKQE